MKFKPTWFAWGILIAALAISGLFWRLALSERDKTAFARFEVGTAAITAQVKRSITAYEQALRAGAALLKSRGEITKEGWQIFLETLEVGRRYPGIQGLGYAEVIPASRLESHLKKFRLIYGEDYAVTPAHPKTPLTSIVLLAPPDWRNRPAIGFNMMSSATRRTAMERARDTGQLTTSGRVTLTQEASKDVQAGFLMYLPIYRDDKPVATIADRRQAIRGYVFGPFRAKDFMAGTLGTTFTSSNRKVDIAVYDGTDQTPGALLVSSAQGNNPLADMSFYRSERIELPNRTWLLTYAATNVFEQELQSSKPTVTLALGILISVILWSLSWTLAKRQILAERTTEHLKSLTRELSHRVRNTLSVVQSIANRTMTVNRTTEEASRIFLQRLHALARAHTMLFDSYYSGADVRQVVQAEVAAFPQQVSIFGPRITMSPQVTQTFALILHELASNAIQHGALSTEQGRVEIVWQIFKKEDKSYFRFSWQEQFGPPVKSPIEQGFGYALLLHPFLQGTGNAPCLSFDSRGLRYAFEATLGALSQSEDASS